MPQYRLVLERPSGNTREITDEQSLQATLMHTAGSTWQATLPYVDETLEAWAYPNTEVRLYWDDAEGHSHLLFRGNCYKAESDETTNTTTLAGDDVTYKLRQGELEVSYSNITVEDAIRDYWSRLSGWDATVYTPTTEEVVSNDVAQQADTNSEWNDLVTIASDEPLEVSNGKLQVQQSNTVKEGENVDASSGFQSPNVSTYSAGAAGEIGTGGGYLRYYITPAYDIPADRVGIAIRDRIVDDGTSVDGLTWTFNANSLDQPVGTSKSLSWTDLSDSAFYSTGSENGYDGGSLSAGTTYTLELSASSTATPVGYHVDVISVYDSAYTYTFDNDNGGSGGYLDGPELYPDVEATQFAQFDSTFNVSAAEIASTWDDVSNKQELAVSNDAGTTWLTTNNSETLDKTFSSTVGSTLDTRLKLSRYGSRTTATPQTGFKGQSVDSITVRYSANDLPVIDNQTVSDDHLSNLQHLHGAGNFHFSINYGETDPVSVESFQRAEQTRVATWVTRSKTRERNTESYANEVVVKGPKQADGTRPSVTATAPQSEIDAVGSKITKTLIRPNLTNQGDRESLARSELSKRVAADEIQGSIQIVPQFVAPGYQYAVPGWDSKPTLEQVMFSEEGGRMTGTLQFREDPGLMPQLASYQAGISTNRDAL